MKGFSNGQFDTSAIERGMLITVTSQHGGSKSGIVTGVSPSAIRYSLLDAFLGSFQEEEVTAEKVANGFLTFQVRKHLEESVQTEKTASHTAHQRSVKELLHNELSIDEVEAFLKTQDDVKVIAYVLSQLQDLPQNQSAKLFFALPDSIIIPVKSELGNVSNWDTETTRVVEAKTRQLLENRLRREKITEGETFENPLEDLFEKLGGGLGGFGGFGGGSNPLTDMLEELKNGKNPLFDLFGGGFGQNKQQTPNPQDMMEQLQEVLRQFLNNDDNNKPGGRH